MELEEYLVQHPENKNNLNDLLSSYSREIFVPFIGAGPSVPLVGLDWENLLNNMRSKLGIKTRIRRSVNGPNYPREFSKIYKKLDDRKRFFDVLFNTLKPTQTHFTAFHSYLPDAFDTFVTTNYDLPIEEAYERHRNKKLKRHYFSCYEMDNLRDCVVYLHGHENITFAVIKEEDYDYFYPTVSMKNGIPIIEKFLENLYRNRCIIFFGFSFSDRYIIKFLTELALRYMSGKHFWILDESTPMYNKVAKEAYEYGKKGKKSEAGKVIRDFYERFSKLGIKPIVYGNKRHIFVEEVIQRLGKKPITKAKVSANKASVPEN